MRHTLHEVILCRISGNEPLPVHDLFCLSTPEVYLACSLLLRLVSSYLTFSPLPPATRCRWNYILCGTFCYRGIAAPIPSFSEGRMLCVVRTFLFPFYRKAIERLAYGKDKQNMVWWILMLNSFLTLNFRT